MEHPTGSSIAKMFVDWLAFFLVLGLSEGQVLEEEWVLNFDSPVYVCSDDVSQTFVDTSAVEVQRHNETVAYMTGKFKFLQGIQPCTVVELIVEKDKNGRVDVMITHDLCDLCAEMGEDSAYYKYLKHFGFPKTCPFDEGEYDILDFVPSGEDLPLSAANEARYLVTMNFYHNPNCDCKEDRNFIGCIKLDFVIEPL